MANEFHFPQEIIHHIQSFLNAKESARTSILSKSWYTAWSTRPVLIFDENDFPPYGGVSRQFSQFTRETLHRYKRQNLKAVKFVIRMNVDRSSYGYYPLADELIISALKLCVSEIDLKFNNHCSRCIVYSLPVQVFTSTSLTRLSVERCFIGGVIGNRVLCSSLKSLVLSNVDTTNDVIQNILASCQWIENLDLHNCDGLERLNVNKLLNIVELHVVVTMTTNVEFNNGINVNEFRYLHRLQLDRVRIGDDFFTKFSSMFPCIEDLSLGCCVGCEEINISSHSLKRLRLYDWAGLKKVQLNVPNISKIVFLLWVDTMGNRIKSLPSISFVSVSRDWDWECDVRLSCQCNVFEANWLRKFLIELSHSRIYLRITFEGKSIISCKQIPYFPCMPVVENLTVCSCSSSNTMQNLLLGLSRSCCPKLITECRSCFDYSIWN